MSLASVVAMLARCCLWLVKREAARSRKKHPWFTCPHEHCDCECCQWARGIMAEADEKLGRGWE